MFYSIFAISLLGLIAAFGLAYWVLNQDTGNKKMQEIAGAIKEGAMAFLRRQYVTIGIFAIILTLIIFGAYYFS